MKVKIVCTYTVPGDKKLLDEYIMGKIDAEFIGSGFDFKTQERDLKFEIDIDSIISKEEK